MPQHRKPQRRRRSPAAARGSLFSRKLHFEPLEDRRLLAVDFGDAPDPYPTTLADDGARHEAIGPRLGALRDEEADGQPSTDADGDGADEDGVTFGSIMVGQLDASVTVNVQNAPAGAKLDAWIDFNGDGSWGGPGEQIFDAATVNNGNNALLFDVPSWAASGNTYARFRLSTAGDLGLGGDAADGEVEDYQVTIDPPARALGVFAGQNSISTDADFAYSVFAADVDGDGDMDVLSASTFDDKIAWYENDGSGGFTAHTISTDADGAKSVFAADVDGDGDIDVLSASRNDDKIAWYENDGSDGFTAHTISTTALDAVSVFAADMDGDGDIDVLSASTFDDKIAWYENDGSGGFTAHTISTDADGARSVFAADVDGDVDVDVLSASSSSGDDKIAWYENDGSGGFTAHTISTDADGARSVFAADVDGDGDIDVLSASRGEIAWYENDGSEAFTAQTISTAAFRALSVFAADVDGDGDVDVLSASFSDSRAIAWYENDGSTSFTAHTISTAAAGARSVFAADVDGDGDLDVLSASFVDDKIAWYENVNPIPTVYPLPLPPLAPTGSLVYGTAAQRSIETVGGLDTLQVDLDAGQSVTIVIDPLGGLQAAVELRDSAGALVHAASAAARGETVVSHNFPIAEAGIYTMTVSGLGETTGPFMGRLLLNADVENESHGGASNDEAASAQDIQPAMLPLGGSSAERAAVIGSNVGSDDWYRFALADGQSATMALSRSSSGFSSMELYDATGTRIAFDAKPVARFGDFLDMTSDGLATDYFVRVFGNVGEYNLVVTRGARLAVGSVRATPDLTINGTVLGHLDASVGVRSRDFTVGVTAGDVLEMTTSTPADGAGEFVNLLDPRVELFDPSGTLVGSDEDGAGDGHNAALTHTASKSGTYTVRVLQTGETAGEFVLNVAGHSGSPAAFTISSIDPEDGEEARTNPPVVTMNFNDSILLSSLDAADLTIGGFSATSIDVIDHNTVRFLFGDVLAPGEYNVNIAAGSITDLQGTSVEALSSTLVVPRTVSGTLTSDRALGGQWRVNGDLVVPAGVTLTIEPGAELTFAPGVELTVNGRIVAIGTPEQRVRLAGAAEATKWDGIHIRNSLEDNVFAYVDIEGAQSRDGSIGAFDSVLMIDNMTFAGSLLRYVGLDDASAVIRDSVFPDRFGPDETPLVSDTVIEMINGRGIMPGGRMIIEGNTFGTNKGHNDIIDFSGPVRPAPILQVLNNVFLGTADEMLDLGGDAYIEGNVFMHVRRDEFNDSSGHTNVISTGDGAAGATIVLVRNVFFDIEHVIDLEDDHLAILEHNTIVGITPDGPDPGNGTLQEYSVVNLVIRDRNDPGRGAHLNGNIIVDVPERIFGEPDTARNGSPGSLSDLIVNNTLLPNERCGDVIGQRGGTIVDLGTNILCGDAMLADVATGDFSLLPGSPAIGAGVHGLDLGALVPAGATLSEVPAVIENDFATFTVDGPGIFEYQFRLDDAAWSDATSVDEPIELTELADGAHRLELVGMNYAGVWQDEADAVVRTWTVGGPGLPADLTGNGFVDFEDLTVLLAAWNQNVSAAEGNLVDADTTPVNFGDLTVLLAAWTGPGPAGAPVGRGLAAAEEKSPSVWSNREKDSESEAPQPAAAYKMRAARRDVQTSGSASGTYGRLQAVAVDRAMGEGSMAGSGAMFGRRAYRRPR